jgi:hypothetical protein
MLPVWFLNAEGQAAVKARAEALRSYLRIRRDMRQAVAVWGAL